MEEGVFFDEKDYAGLVRRLLILLVDGLLLLAGLIATLIVFIVLDEFGVADPFWYRSVAFGYLSACLLYLVIIKRTDLGTVGYLVAGARIVDLTGNRPSIPKMAFRALFVFLGPANLLIDLLWLTGDTDKQSVRDKIVGTYVVKKGAQPSGRGKQRIVSYTMLGYSLMVREVSRKAESGGGSRSLQASGRG